MNKRIGLIQSRGLGDITLALPIAHFYYKQGSEVYWPICETFLSSVKDTAPWVNWIPLPVDKQGQFFYHEPMKRLRNLKCDDIICLYQSLNVVPELADVPWFQIQKFDEFKYTKAGVPFINKWTLKDCITRNFERENALYQKLVKNPQYYVTHFKGSTFEFEPDLSSIPADWQRIDVDENITDCVFDWLSIIHGAQALIAIDSVIANITDQLLIDIDKYWLPRSHIHLTPVLGSAWTILEPPPTSIAAQKIFSSAPPPNQS